MNDFLGYAIPAAIFVVLFVVFAVIGRRRERARGIPQKPFAQAVAPVVVLIALSLLVTTFAMSLDTAAARIGTILAFLIVVTMVGGVIAWRRRETD